MGNTVSRHVAAAAKTGVLALQHAGLDALPPAVATLTALRTLDLTGNKLRDLYARPPPHPRRAADDSRGRRKDKGS